jgi:hypothetical protein
LVIIKDVQNACVLTLKQGMKIRMTSTISYPKHQPDCDYIDYCGDKAVSQVKIGSKIKNLCFYHAREEFEGVSKEDIEIDESLEIFV